MAKLSPLTLIVITACFSRILHLTILSGLSKALPLFDTSPSLLLPSPPPALRWDAIHFSSIAYIGYEYEQQVAFQPGWLAVMRLAGEGVRFIRAAPVVELNDVILGGTIVANFAFVAATLVLYKLTERIFNPTFAFLTSLLYLLPPTATPSAPYTEPIYSLLTFSGIYLLSIKRQMVLAGLCFAGATTVRSTGIFNSITLMCFSVFGDAHILDLDVSKIRKMWKPFLPAFLAVAPFLMFQHYSETVFCTRESKLTSTARPWCSNSPPISYGFVQKLYWNVGPFEYWTVAQLPNIALVIPIIFSSLIGFIKYFSHLVSSSQVLNHGTEENPPPPILFELYSVHLLTMALLLFTSHTQIALRVCLGDPVVWWNAVKLGFDNVQMGETPMGQVKMNKFGRYWIGWTVVWGAVAIVLWAGHYPPA
ncbi:GPI mannosyltransferase 2 [Cryptococcus neoformans Gb118]|nr:GPI mannosyltransferase 2 [Cryptococcus neoformans var. grubii Bt15]OXG85084.1 GPI mannosyltransferase 2 [Cryptococcus neoformans var. grubii MW-RSA36]OXL09959.1 GPI mannosyltransferase 2 [Cryptococcus neoformans var. grubii Gb118]